MKTVTLSVQTVDKVLAYLKDKPFIEVNDIIAAIFTDKQQLLANITPDAIPVE